MMTLLYTIHILVCLFLMLVILLQAGKGGGIGALGSGASQQVFGGRGASSLLERVTTATALVFMLTSITLSYINSQSESSKLAKLADKKKTDEDKAKKNAENQLRQQVEQKAAEQKAAEQKAAEQKAAEQKALEEKHNADSDAGNAVDGGVPTGKTGETGKPGVLPIRPADSLPQPTSPAANVPAKPTWPAANVPAKPTSPAANVPAKNNAKPPTARPVAKPPVDSAAPATPSGSPATGQPLF